MTECLQCLVYISISLVTCSLFVVYINYYLYIHSVFVEVCIYGGGVCI